MAEENQAAEAEAAEKAAEAEAAPDTKPEEVVEKPTTEVDTGDVVLEEPADNDDRSRLGRKVGELTRNMETLTNTFTAFLETQNKPAVSEVQNLSDDDVLTVGELKKMQAAEKAQAESRMVEYSGHYLNKIKSFEDGSELHDAIVKLCTDDNAEFNKLRNTGSGATDAHINYLDAKAFLLNKSAKDTSGKPNVQGKTTRGAAVSTTQAADSDAPKPVKIDAQAQPLVDYLKNQGVSEEAIQKKLRGDVTA